jgi:hypothetical protein
MSTPKNSQTNIDKLFDDYISSTTEDESSYETIEALNEVIYSALLEKLDLSDGSDEQKKHVRMKMREYMISMDFNNPALAHAEKMIRSIGLANYKEAAEYLERLYALRSKIFRKAQSIAAKAPKKKDAFGKLLAKLVAKEPDISAEEVIKRLESDTYLDVISDNDKDCIYYQGLNGAEKSVRKVNIPARLSRLRKKP